MAKTIEEIMSKRGVEIQENEMDPVIKSASNSAQRLMDIYYNCLSTTDMEFTYWYDRAFRENDGDILVVRRAKALACAFSHVNVTVLPEEKLVGQKTKNMRGTFPSPWVSEGFFISQADAIMQEVDTPQTTTADELSQYGTGGGNVTASFGDVISLAGKFGVRRDELPVLLKIAKSWKGKSVEDLCFKYEKELPDNWQKKNFMDTLLSMFDSGYTLPQGREVANYYYLLQYGFDGLIKLVEEKIKKVAGKADGDGINGVPRLYYYVACREILNGLQAWVTHYAEAAKLNATLESDPVAKKEMEELAQVLYNVAHKKPSTFREGLQMCTFAHMAIVNEDPMSGMSIGRLGQVLNPYYEKDIRDGVITEEEAIELLEQYRIKITCIECFASAGVNGGVLSGNTFNNLGLAGLNREGLSAVTPLEYLIVEAAMRCKTTQPTLSCLYDEKTPDDFLLKCAQAIKMGMGFPAFMNNQNGINFMMRQYGDEGMTLEDARAWMLGGCLESAACCWMPLDYDGKVTWIPGGASPTAGTGVHFLANPKFINVVLNNGKDDRTGVKLFEPHNRKLETFEDFWDQWCKYYSEAIDVLERANNIEMDVWRQKDVSVINSLLKPDCLEIGKNVAGMGYRYNGSINIETCGTITCINSLVAIQELVYNSKKYTLEEIKDAIFNNFGYKSALITGNYSMDFKKKENENSKIYDQIFADCLNAPKYGNCEPLADDMFKRYEDWLHDRCIKSYSLFARPMYACQISVSTHGPQGAATLATADGRLAGTTYGDGSVSAVAGTDKNGIYAIFDAATVYDQSIGQNTQMNLKLHPTAVRGQSGTRKLLDLIRAYMRKGGFHVQFNIIDSKILRAAQKKPDNYRDLMVRVAGFTQFWCELGKAIQDEVIYRSEYETTTGE